jgi:hypothetical protein
MSTAFAGIVPHTAAAKKPTVTRFRRTGPLIFDPTDPVVQTAMMQIQMEMALIATENPTWPPRQVHREAGARCAPALVAALEACDRKIARRWA